MKFYDRNGNEITDAPDGTSATIVWARMYEDHAYRTVKITQLAGGAYVSTIWMGFDTDVFNDGTAPPVIFETMAFSPEGNSDPVRHATEQQAIDYHDYIVARWPRP